MNKVHPRITCDVCGWNNIAGIRYACLVCEEYDMCEVCYHHRRSSHQHKPYHPMQAILSEDEFFDSLRGVRPDEVRIFCCPYCGEHDLNVAEMIAHCQRYHGEGGHPVRCPICLVYKCRNRRLLKTTLLQHAQSRHSGDCSGPVWRRAPPRQPTWEDTRECSICMEQMGGMASTHLHCGHQFHSGCITNWLRTSASCPLCRADVRQYTTATIGYLEMF